MKKIFLLFVLLLAAGCASVAVKKYQEDIAFPATDPGDILIYTMKPQGRSLTEIGEITVKGATEWGQIERIFRIKAAEMGGDGVYVFDKKTETRQYVSPNDCYLRYNYYYPYRHFGRRYRYHHRYYPIGYYYCYGYPQTVETQTYISAVGIVIKYQTQPQ